MRLLLFLLLFPASILAQSEYVDEYNRLFDLLSRDANSGQTAIQQSELINRGTLQSKAIDSLLATYINHPTGFEYYDLPSESEINALAGQSKSLALRLSIYQAYNLLIMGNIPGSFELIDSVIKFSEGRYEEVYVDARFAKAQFYARDDFYDQALNELAELVPLSKPLAQREFKGEGFTQNILLWFGLNLGYKGEHQRAIEQCHDSVQHFASYSEAFKNNNYYLLALDCLSRNYIALGQDQQAIKYIKRYQEFALLKGDKGASFYINVFMAQFYNGLKQTDLAALAINNAKQFTNPILNQQDWFDLKVQEIEIEITRSNLVLASQLARDAEQQLPAHNSDWKAQKLNLYLLLADIYARQNQFEKAFGYLNEAVEIKQDIDNNSSESMSMANYFNTVINHQKTKLVQQQAQIVTAQLERKTTYNYWLSFLSLGLVTLALALFVILRKLLKQNNEIRESSIRDGLTGILNRQGFYDSVNAQIKLLKRQDSGGTVCLIDLDYFKQINDNYGHDIGDKVLQWFGSNLTKVLRESDICARYGGEEFIIFCPNTDLQGASQVIQKLRNMNFTSANEIPVLEKPISFSAGISYFNGNSSLDEAIKTSDQLLYDAKRQGRDRITIGSSPVLPPV